MSKIVATFDTETKELSLTIDGQNKENIQSVNMCSYSNDESDEKSEKYGYFEAYFKTLEENGVHYRMSAQGSKLKDSSIIEDGIRKAFFK